MVRKVVLGYQVLHDGHTVVKCNCKDINKLVSLLHLSNRRNPLSSMAGTVRLADIFINSSVLVSPESCNHVIISASSHPGMQHTFCYVDKTRIILDLVSAQ